jgi:hypothetical protein
MSRSLRALRSGSPLLRRPLQLRPLLVSPCLRPRDVQRRYFVGQVLGIIANPFETLRQLDESRKLLEQTRQVFHPFLFQTGYGKMSIWRLYEDRGLIVGYEGCV